MQRKSANQKHQSKANIPSESIDFVQSSPNIPSKTNLAKTTQGRNQDLRFLADICGFLLGFCARFAGWFCDEKNDLLGNWGLCFCSWMVLAKLVSNNTRHRFLYRIPFAHQTAHKDIMQHSITFYYMGIIDHRNLKMEPFFH